MNVYLVNKFSAGLERMDKKSIGDWHAWHLLVVAFMCEQLQM